MNYTIQTKHANGNTIILSRGSDTKSMIDMFNKMVYDLKTFYSTRTITITLYEGSKISREYKQIGVIK